jgi:MarR family transcriptional regulator, negative regulator of the multidrug operon emrRAB
MNEITRPVQPFSEVEEGICRLIKRLPELPKQEVILTRLYLHVAKALRDVANQVLRPFELNYVSFSTLMMLFGSCDNAINPSKLCDVTGESRTNMTRIVDDLVARGYIKRHPSTDDRRRVVLTLTAKGEDLVRKILPPLWEEQIKIYRRFGADEKKTLEALLKKQLTAIEAAR